MPQEKAPMSHGRIQALLQESAGRRARAAMVIRQGTPGERKGRSLYRSATCAEKKRLSRKKSFDDERVETPLHKGEKSPGLDRRGGGEEGLRRQEER